MYIQCTREGKEESEKEIGGDPMELHFYISTKFDRVPRKREKTPTGFSQLCGACDSLLPTIRPIYQTTPPSVVYRKFSRLVFQFNRHYTQYITHTATNPSSYICQHIFMSIY